MLEAFVIFRQSFWMDIPAKLSGWRELLNGDLSLAEADRVVFEAAIRVYLKRCEQAGLAVEVASAKEFVQKVVPQVMGGQVVQEQWRRALRWLFGFSTESGARMKDAAAAGKQNSDLLQRRRVTLRVLTSWSRSGGKDALWGFVFPPAHAPARPCPLSFDHRPLCR